jgi:hypothetical protein
MLQYLIIISVLVITVAILLAVCVENILYNNLVSEIDKRHSDDNI